MPGDDTLYATRAPRSSGGRRLLIGLLLLLFMLVLGATAWRLTRSIYGAAQAGDAAGNAAAAVPGVLVDPAATPTGTAALPLPAAPTAGALESRMLDLEQRVVRASVAAQAASGYANRAEAIMVAFAARRALDAGAPLGYIEGQLRVLFDAGQPRAVATIINAANDPVTINKLRAGLEDINLLIAKGDPKESWWSATTRTLGSLVVIRRAGAPAPQPDQRIAHARRAVEAGQIEDAITDMAALPAQPAIAQWLDQARRYNEARRALDVIEAAAILEPRTAPLLAPAATQAAGATAAEKKPEAGKK